MQNEQTLKELSDSIINGLKNRRSENMKFNRPYFKTGVRLIDLVMGGEKGVHGNPAGRILNVVGDKSAGKTFINNEIIANAHWTYGDKFKWMYADCEHGYSFDTQTLYGMDICTEESDKPETVEEAFYRLWKFCDSLGKDEFGVYVIDSLDALTSEEQDKRAEERIAAMDKGKTYDKGTMGMGKAKYLSQEFFAQLCKKLEKYNVLLVIVSQIRENVDPFSFEKYDRAGGKAMDFYCFMVIWLATAKKYEYEEGERKVILGGTNKLKVTKGKVPRPYRECFYTYYFNYGIDNVETGVDYLFDCRTRTGDISAPAAKCCEWEKNPDKKPMVGPEIRQWLIDNKWYDDYRATLSEGERFSMDTAMKFINGDESIKSKFGESFALAMDRNSLIKYIRENNLEDELDRRVEEKWEAFEDEAAKHTPAVSGGKYAKFYATQPQSTDKDVII